MKQTAKRILSLVLSLLMLVSMLTVYASAANNYVPDDEYYDRITLDAYVVNPAWASLTEADHLKAKVTYTYRGVQFEETYHKDYHFATLQAAYDKSVADKVSSPVILVTPGTYTDTLKIKGNLTLIGANAGISPFVRGANKTDIWEVNPDRPADEALLAAVIFVDKATKGNIEVKFDGLELYRGFSFIEAGSRKNKTTVDCVNTVINGAGNASYGTYAATDVFSFSNSSTLTTTLNISETYVKNLKTSSVAGKGLTVLNAKNVFHTMSQTAFLGNADGPKDQNPTYYISDSMFYNNQATFGVLSIDPSANDSSSRTSTLFEVYDCVFLDGPDTPADDAAKNVAPINAALTSPKNVIKVHDNWFEGKQNYNASIIGLTLGGSATTNEFSSSLYFNENVIIGYYNLPNTTGMVSTSVVDFTGNYYADCEGKQIDPVYNYAASYANVKMSYFYVNQAKTVKSSIFEIKSFGVKGAAVDNTFKTVSVVLDYGKTYKLALEGNDPETVFTVYDSTKTNVLTELDTTKLESGVEKNKFYAVATSPKYPSYSYIYEVTVSTFDPATSVKFDKPNTYLISEDIADYSTGASYYAMWDGILYEYTVGQNAFVGISDVFAATDETPTVLIPAGEYTKELYIPRSVVILGAKHGINPNIPQFENPDTEWEINPERNQPDQETVLKNTVVNVEPEGDKAVVIVDGLTFGEKSGAADKSKKENSYTTLSIENCISDNAGGGSYFSKEAGADAVMNTIFTVGNQDETNSHKTTRIINFRMEKHPSVMAFTGYYEHITFDGCYFGNNGNFLFSNEVAAPKGLNFDFEMFNNCFYKNSPSNYYFIINNNTTLSDDREYNRIRLDNNIFFDTTGSGAGIIGVRFASDRDIFHVTNNTFYDPSASHYIPGNVNWYIGDVGVTNTADIANGLGHLQILDQDNIIVKYNRFLGSIIKSYSNMNVCNPKSYWDLTDNFYSSSTSKTATGVAPVLGDDGCHHSDSYFLDWDMTKPSNPSPAYNTELNYVFGGADKATKTFKDTVDASVGTYEFDITMNTRQAKYAIYTDAELTNEVANPVTLGGGDNVYYIKFTSYDESVSDLYTATVTKPASTGADVLSFGNWKISGKSIFASVPVGTTNYVLPTPTVSVGATYAIYTDYECTEEVTSNNVTVPAQYPAVRYIKVVSQDLKTTNIYTVSVVQAQNDQAEIIAIEGANKNGSKFTASTDKAEFTIRATISDGATLSAAIDGKELFVKPDGSFVVESIIDTKTVTLTVTSETGAKNTFSLEIIKGVSSSTVESIVNMYAPGGDKSAFTTSVYEASFKVVPTLTSSSATWKLYEDAACTKELKDATVILRANTTNAYLKVTSADKTSTSVITLTIVSSEFKKEDVGPLTKIFSVKDAVEVEGTKNNYTITVAPGTTKYTIQFVASTAGYEASNYIIAGDHELKYRFTTTSPNPTVAQSFELPLTGRNNVFYVKIFVVNGELTLGAEEFKVTVVAPQTTVTTYSDASKISSWAKDEVEFLNKNGYAYFVGNEKKEFEPKKGINRFEVAVVVSKILGINTKSYLGTKHLFEDEIPSWADPYVKAVYGMGIMSGKETTKFDGYAETTREEFARIIVGTIAFARGEGSVDELYNSKKTAIDYDYDQIKFEDEAKIAKWARSSIRLAVAYYKVMNGASEGNKLYINPKKAITREEVAVLVANYSGYNAK